MTQRRVVPRALAERDVLEAIGHYAREGGEALALRFAGEVEATFTRMVRAPALGSPRYAQELGIAGLRHWAVRRFPYLVFYREAPDHLDVWRVLHARRDIAAWLGEGDAG
jgi:toxin ParE1/3/4